MIRGGSLSEPGHEELRQKYCHDFATYTETRFRFATERLAYQWADDQHQTLDVLDFGVFPDFQALYLRLHRRFQ